MHFPKEVPSIVEKIEESGLFSRHEMLLKVKCCPQVSTIFASTPWTVKAILQNKKKVRVSGGWLEAYQRERKRSLVARWYMTDPNYTIYSDIVWKVWVSGGGRGGSGGSFVEEENYNIYVYMCSNMCICVAISKSYCGGKFVKSNFHTLRGFAHKLQKLWIGWDQSMFLPLTGRPAWKLLSNERDVYC